MRRPSKYYAELFIALAHDIAPRDLDTLTTRFVELLAKENALSRYHEIQRLIAVSLDRIAGSEELVVTTASPLAPAALSALKKAATRAGFHALRVTVDSKIGGGAILNAGDRRVDASVEGSLERLYESLVSH